jgi:hypothetical protein
MYDRRRQGRKRHRRNCRGGAVAKGASAATSPARGLVFEKTLETACGTIAQQPLALAVAHATHSRTTVVATVRGGRTRRFTHGLVTSRPSAKNLGMFVCCVTTRSRSGGRRALTFLRHRGRGDLAFATLPLRLGMLLASFSVSTTLVLPLGRLPTPQFRQAFRLSTVPLVVTPCLKPPPATFAQTSPPPQPPAPGGHTAFVGMLTLFHGRY